MASNNDCGFRDFDMERFQLSKHFCFPWPVNVSIISVSALLGWPHGLCACLQIS
uniref:WD-40 repeat family protein n=2 Tax=Rhizophora mucronata TaxID=61149 RepID=A0A2P2KTT7_RHIMU